MRNLKLLCHKWEKFPQIANVNNLVIPCDKATDLYVCDNLKIYCVDILSNDVSMILDIKEEVPVSDDAVVVNLIFFYIQRTICVAINSGELIILNVDSLEVTDVINVSELYGGKIKAIGASPDQDLLVVVTAQLSLVLMDCTFARVHQVSLLEQGFGEGGFISVGWGKKETQFHGSEGKQAAKQTVDVQPTDEDIQKDLSTVTWRGDGSIFTVGFYLNGSYTFKVFDREATLQFTGEKQPNLECNFAWRPSGNLIATTQNFPNKYVVAFFEKNGLRHGEFVLPFKKADILIKQLLWSGDSDILCVWCVNKKNRKSFLLIYTVNNYHWYLKQSLPFKREILKLFWDESNVIGRDKILHLFLAGGEYVQFELSWCVDRSNGTTDKDNAIVGVVDGTNILITCFKNTVVPPPMASHTIQVAEHVNQIIFGPVIQEENEELKGVDSNSFMAVSKDGAVSLLVFNLEKNTFEIKGIFQLNDFNINYTICQYLWITKSLLLCVCSRGDQTDCLILKMSKKTDLKVKIMEKIVLNDEIVGMSCVPNEKQVILQTITGNLLKLSVGTEVSSVCKYLNTTLPERCLEFYVHIQEDRPIVFGLTHRNRFYMDDKEVANNVNSFFVHSDFLMLTTLTHQLLCCPLKTESITAFQLNYKASEKDMEPNNSFISSRKLERGSRLVIAVSGDTRTVLQLPRGNLETIQPRALSLKIIGNYLDDFKYYKAFNLMRKQRINLNLIYDHDPEKFLDNIDEFISKVSNASWLSLFISELDNSDVTKTMYSSSYFKNKVEILKDGKVKMVCSKMREALERCNENNKYFLPILTTYVKNNNIHDLEQALLKIKEVKLETDTEKSSVTAEDALKYLLYLVNVNQLFDISLGMYDFELAMFVANKSQKDPKEYVPYLNELKSMEENYKRFTIDNDLKRYDYALKNLILCGAERSEELIRFVKRHNLYSLALENLSKEDVCYQACAEEFGSHLMARRHYSEAGVMYKRSKNLTKALDCFIEALDWETAVYIMDELQMQEEEKKKINETMLRKLKDSSKYMEAALFLQRLPTTDPSEIVSCALQGRNFVLALRVCQQYKRNEIMENTLCPAVLAHHSHLLSVIQSNTEQFIQLKSRLVVVRQNKAQEKLCGDRNLDVPLDCDLYSDTSSIMGSTTSRGSCKTFRSSKNRRKHERKLVSLREGSRFEDVALVRALHGLVSGTFSLRQEAHQLCQVLQWLERDLKLKQLQDALESLLKLMTKSFNDIWTAELLLEANKLPSTEENEVGGENSNITEAATTLEPHIRIPPVIQEYKWKHETL